MESPYTEHEGDRWCTICGTWFDDTTPTYCRPCTNDYARWKYSRGGGKAWANRDYTSVKTYRAEMNKPHIPKPKAPVEAPTEAASMKACPVCLKDHRNPYSGYCVQCKSGYQAWARRQKKAYQLSDGMHGTNTPTMEEYRNLVHDRPRAGL